MLIFTFIITFLLNITDARFAGAI